MKTILIFLISSIIAFADLSSIDNTFIKFSEDFIKKQTTNVKLSQEVNNIMRPKIITQLENNSFSRGWYIAELEKAFNQAIKMLEEKIEFSSEEDKSEQMNEMKQAQQSSIGSFSCLCLPSLTSAFKKFDKYYTDNLGQLQDQLTKLKNNIKSNAKSLQNNLTVLDSTNKLLEDSIIEIKKNRVYIEKANIHNL